MTSKTHRTEIHVETHEVTVIRFHGKRSRDHCEQCCAAITGPTDEQTDAASEVTQDEVFRAPKEKKFSISTGWEY